ncbi:MAG: hypothetical protein HYW01_01510 [Deltaproteobacteria bacterium]|nr:hypothetical protein [Deltaproteobacteria bacterium]
MLAFECQFKKDRRNFPVPHCQAYTDEIYRDTPLAVIDAQFASNGKNQLSKGIGRAQDSPLIIDYNSSKF